MMRWGCSGNCSKTYHLQFRSSGCGWWTIQFQLVTGRNKKKKYITKRLFVPGVESESPRNITGSIFVAPMSNYPFLCTAAVNEGNLSQVFMGIWLQEHERGFEGLLLAVLVVVGCTATCRGRHVTVSHHHSTRFLRRFFLPIPPHVIIISSNQPCFFFFSFFAQGLRLRSTRPI